MAKRTTDPPCGWTYWQGASDFVNRYSYVSRFVAGKRVLDLGCANGWGTNYLRKRKPSIMIAGDVNSQSVSYAGARYANKGISFVILDAQRLPFKESTFDVAIAMEVIEHIADDHAFLGEVKRVLKPRGLFICSTPVREPEKLP